MARGVAHALGRERLTGRWGASAGGERVVRGQQMKRKFALDRNVGRIILRAENSSNTYTTEFIASLLDEEGTASGLFDARSINLGVRVP